MQMSKFYFKLASKKEIFIKARSKNSFLIVTCIKERVEDGVRWDFQTRYNWGMSAKNNTRQNKTQTHIVGWVNPTSPKDALLSIKFHQRTA